MKKKINIKLLGVFALLIALFSCEPFMDDNPDSMVSLPPDPSEMDFSITPGDDDFNFTVELVSPNMSGIYSVAFDLGNGSVVKEESTNAYYPLPGDYDVTMTITTNGGTSTISKTHTTTETDYSIFTEERYIFLTGGIENTEGKSWKLDAETSGHMGVGPSDDPNGTGTEWWAAGPFAKDFTGAYDDEIIFNLNGFATTYNNKGVSYVKNYRANDPDLAQYYLNPRENDTDYDVDYQTPVNGTWSYVDKDDGMYLVLNAETPLFPCFDVGAKNNEYKVVEITENSLKLTAVTEDKYEPWTRWSIMLIPTDYERPKVEYTVAVNPTGEVNAYGVQLTVVNIPPGQSIDKMSVDFGDGTVVETENVTEVLTNTFMRKGTYNVAVTVTSSVGTETETIPVTITDNHPDYQEFLLNEMVMYADFSEVMLAPVNGQDCDVFVADNPDRTYPNKSAKVGFYSKTNQQWANANMELPSGHRFDLRQISTFKLMVYGEAGDVVLFKLENTDKGGDAWMTGTEVRYTIKETNTWEVAEFDFEGAGVQPGSEGWKWWPEPVSYDVANDDFYNHDFYNIIRIMLNPDIENDQTHEFYFDEIAGPHVEGIKSATIK